MCGRIIGYQVASPDAFNRFNPNSRNLDGIIVSHGAQQDYIWSYVAGVTENSPRHSVSNFPCSTEAGITPPTFIGEHYYCESGNPTDTYDI